MSFFDHFNDKKFYHLNLLDCDRLANQSLLLGLAKRKYPIGCRKNFPYPSGSPPALGPVLSCKKKGLIFLYKLILFTYVPLLRSITSSSELRMRLSSCLKRFESCLRRKSASISCLVLGIRMRTQQHKIITTNNKRHSD